MSHKLGFALLFAVLTYGQIASQTDLIGRCPAEIPPKKFDWPNLKGVWFEYARYNNEFEIEMECVYEIYKAIKNDTFGIKFSATNSSNQPYSFDATGKILKPAIFSFTLERYIQNQTNIILGVDFKSWVVIYNCKQVGEYRKETAWILTRERLPNKETVDAAKKKLVKNGLLLKYLIYPRQNNCPAVEE